MFIDISLNNDKLTIGTVYRSPNQELTANMQFIDHQTPTLKAISKSQTPTMITGDQNYNLLKYDKNCVSDFIDLMYENSFYPAITKPTRFTATSATVLHHMWTNILNKKLASAVMVDCVADHLPILFSIQLHNPPTQIRNQSKQQRNYSSENLIKFMEALQNVDTKPILTLTDVNDAYRNFECNYNKIFNDDSPVINYFKSKKNKNKSTTWYDSELQTSTKLNSECIKNL